MASHSNATNLVLYSLDTDLVPSISRQKREETIGIFWMILHDEVPVSLRLSPHSSW